MPRVSLRLVTTVSLVAIGFCISIWRVALPWWDEKSNGKITLRFCHWQLEPGVRRALDALSRDYEALHPNVRVKQIAIPGRIYRQWGSTQLVGGQPPDLMQIGLGLSRGLFFDDFEPITIHVSAPNPYNAGGPLEGVPWRKTFRDGMRGAFDAKTMECFGASLCNNTVRIFCNRELLIKVTGSDKFPTTFAEMRQLNEQLQVYNQEQGTALSLIAGSRFSALIFFRNLAGTQTQKLATRLNPLIDFPIKDKDFNLAYLEGAWDFDDPAIQQGAHLTSEAAQMMSPGFAQAEGDQAHLRFAQGQALLMVLSSLQATGIIEGSPFEVTIHRIPQPKLSDPDYGPQMHGPIAEAALRTYGAFGISRSSRHPELALDFLRFITSQESCRKFSRLSRNLPTVIGIEPAEEMRPFLPNMQGYPSGPDLKTSSEVIALVEQTRHLLAPPISSPEQYLATLKVGIRDAMHTDISRIIRGNFFSVRLVEPSIGANIQLANTQPDNDELISKISIQLGALTDIEATAYYTQMRLRKVDRTSRSQ